MKKEVKQILITIVICITISMLILLFVSPKIVSFVFGYLNYAIWYAIRLALLLIPIIIVVKFFHQKKQESKLDWKSIIFSSLKPIGFVLLTLFWGAFFNLILVLMYGADSYGGLK